MSDSIKVAIKVRPLIKREKDENLPIQWTVQENSIISTDSEVKKRGDGGFTFDHIFDMNASNSDVFDIVVKPIVNAAVNGINGTVFAYGQTSSGKTYTMMGTAEEPGIIPLAIDHMFDAITNTMGREFLLRVSYLEIYNERVNDLLNKSGTDLKLKEDGTGQVVLKCKEEITNCPENVLAIMKKGDKHRRIGETNMNERSSRSHTIFRITIESREAGGDSDGAIQVSQLNLVDLAGSERARQTGATGERFKEGRHINMSLSTLGLVIMQLSESQDGQKHVNFRDSKLTRLLQSSLGGNAMTTIICAVTPAALDETQCTLSFASRAKSVKNKPQINEVMSDAALLKRYAKQLTKLQHELERVKNVNRAAEVEEMESKLQEKDRINQLLEERIELLKTRIVSGDSAGREESFKCKAKRRQTWGGPGMFNQHLPVFQPKTGLPTIKEVSFEKPHRKSIIQSMDIMHQTFQTAFTDFELELFESERDRDFRDNASDSEEEPFVTKRKSRVTFRDDVMTIKSKNNSFEVTPEKCNTSTQTTSYQVSPSTPKHVLRRCITDLTREFVELREFTTLEKQMICQGNQCCLQEEERQADLEKVAPMDLTPECCDVEYPSNIKERLATLNLCEEKDISRILAEFCRKLKEVEEQSALEKETNFKTLKQFLELQKQFENITSERNEFEYISCELRTELKKKTGELELRNISEESIKQEELKNKSELEKRIKDLTLERSEFERINSELRVESTKSIAELQKQLENIASERNEFEYMRRELYAELNKKSLELEKLKNNSGDACTEVINNKVIELEGEVENLISEKTKVEQINAQLCTELKQMSGFEMKIASEQAEKEKAFEKLSELEKRVEETIAEKSELERVNVESDKKIATLQLEVESERVASQDASRKITELEGQLANMVSEKSKVEHLNSELRCELEQKSSECDLKIASEQAEKEKAFEKLSELEKCIQEIAVGKDELERINLESDKKIAALELEVESERVTSRDASRKISELEGQLANMVSEKSKVEDLNAELRVQLEQKSSECDLKIASAEAEKEKAFEKLVELEKRLEETIAEKSEVERVNVESDKKIAAMELDVESERTKSQDAARKLSEFEERLANALSEKNKLEDINRKLNQEMSTISAKIVPETIESQNVKEMITELEVGNGNVTSTKDEFERIITELRTEVNQRTTELELEQTESRKAMEKISELNKQLEIIMSERDQFEQVSKELKVELNEKSAELNSAIMLKETTSLEHKKDIPEFKNCVENMMSEENGNGRVDECDDISKKHNCELDIRSEADYINENNNLKNYIKDLQETVTNLQTENHGLKDEMQNQSLLSCSRFNESNADTSYLIVNMEAEKSQLEENLLLKSQELEDIKSDVRSLKTDIKKLQETVYLLTTENMEMATKLTTEQENAKQAELNLQKTIDELYARISDVTNEKIVLESDLASLNEQLESMRSKISITTDTEQTFASYQCKIDKLTVENIELSTLIAERNEELQNIKESKSLLYEHECIYKEKVATLREKNEALLSENSELSADLIDKIEENDTLREECDILKNKIEQSTTISENVAEDDLKHLKTENCTLQAEIAELKMKISKLSEENTKLSDNLLETMENLDSTRNAKSNGSKLQLSVIFNNSAQNSEMNQETLEEDTRETLANKVVTLQNEIDHLTCLNKKLSDLKLTSCGQCAHLKNLNESRRTLKLEAKMLNQKLEDLQRKFDQKCEDTEILKRKMNQEFNSTEHESPANTSINFVNEMNVTVMEDIIQNLQDELKTLKTDHNELSTLYEDKCNELEQLHNGTATNTNDCPTSRKNINENSNRIEQIQNYIDQLRSDMDEMKKDSINFTATVNKYKNEESNLLEEINGLKQINEELRRKISSGESTMVNKIQILENELANMSKQIEEYSTREKELESQRLTLEVELESLRAEQQNKNTVIAELNAHVSSLKDEVHLAKSQNNELINSQSAQCKEEELQYLRKQCQILENMKNNELQQQNVLRIQQLEAYINELQMNITNRETFCREFQEKCAYLERLLQEREQEKYIFAQKLQAAEVEVTGMKNNLEMKYKSEFDSMFQQYQQHIKESENNVQKLNETLNKYVNENLNLAEELNSLRNVKEKCNEMMTEKGHSLDHHKMLTEANEKLTEELNDVRKCIIKELRSLKYNVNSIDFSSKPITEIFIVLLQTLVSKEEEIIKTMRETCEKQRRKSEDEKQQCIDAEKRATIWSKELETEIEKLQTEAAEQENVHKEYENKISQLEHLLRESIHEKEMYKEKIEVLEMDFNNFQAEIDKQSKMDSKQEETHRRDKEVQEMLKNKDIELQLKLKSEKEMYEQKIRDLVHNIESYKTKIFELNSTIEGLEANEKQLKNIIEANSTEIRRNTQNAEKINSEFEQLMQAYNELNQQVEKKNSHITEITAILKDKCDLLSEYKSKFESVMPEYEMLKEHVKDKKLIIEKCKEEVEKLKKEREEQLIIIKDKLNSEEIIKAGLNKQLNELNNRNIVLIEELNDLKGKYEELQQVNAKLEKKIRNSTSKIKAEAEIDELKELNKKLRSELEGASNRVSELLEIKNQAFKEFVDLKGKYELSLQENNELQAKLSSYTSKRLPNSFIDEGKYDALLLEKNKIALELEDKKLMLDKKDKELKDHANRIQELTDKNKELDVELDEYADVIRERDAEISKLEDKLYSRLTENVHINELEEKLQSRNEENGKLRDQVEGLKMRLQMDIEEVKLQNEKIVRTLKKENLELQKKLDTYQKQIEMGRVHDGNDVKEVHMNQLQQRIKELDNKLETYAEIIRNRDAEISKLKNNSHLHLTENVLTGDIKQKFELYKTENSKLRNEIIELQIKLRTDMSNERSILRDSAKKQYKNVTIETDCRGYEEKCEQLKKKIHELELQLVSKNGKIATLEIQIQSENFPYQRKCKELEELVLAYRNKNAELNSDIRKLQRTVNDVNAWECDICRRWRVNRKDQACQTIPNNAVRLCSTSSGIVEDHVKIQKLEKEKALMKDLCRARSRQIKELENRVKEFEVKNTLVSRTNEVLQDRSNVTYYNRHIDFAKNSKA